MEIVICSNPSETAGEVISEALRRHRNTAILLLLSGGSALSILEHIDNDVLGPHVTITTLDERFSADPTINNFAQIEVTDFYTNARARGAQAIATRIQESDTLGESGKRFENSLREWRMNNPDGVMLATMGVGEDGHTAGIFPGDFETDFSGDDWVVSYVVPETINPYRERITVTYTFLRTQLAEVVVYAVGEKKKSVIADITTPLNTVEKLPISIVNELPVVTIVTD